jgi:hypothetical protein
MSICFKYSKLCRIILQVHVSIFLLKLVYIHDEFLQVSANHVAIFRDVKYKR